MARRSTQAPKMEEVTDLEADTPTASGFNLEAGIIFSTFIALVTGVVLGYMALGKYFDTGPFAG